MKWATYCITKVIKLTEARIINFHNAHKVGWKKTPVTFEENGDRYVNYTDTEMVLSDLSKRQREIVREIRSHGFSVRWVWEYLVEPFSDKIAKGKLGETDYHYKQVRISMSAMIKFRKKIRRNRAKLRRNKVKDNGLTDTLIHELAHIVHFEENPIEDLFDPKNYIGVNPHPERYGEINDSLRERYGLPKESSLYGWVVEREFREATGRDVYQL